MAPTVTADLTLLGMALEVPVAVLCCCFRDDKALGSSSDAVQDQERAAASAPLRAYPRRRTLADPRLRRPGRPGRPERRRGTPDDQCDERDDAVDPRIKMIPYAAFCTDFWSWPWAAAARSSFFRCGSRMT